MHFYLRRHNTPGGWWFGRSRRAGEAVGASHQQRSRRMLEGGPVQTFPRPATPCNPSFPSGLRASALCKTGAQPGSEKEGARDRSGRLQPGSGPEELSARGLPAGWGLLRPSARSCLGEGLTRRPEPLSARRAAERKGCCQGRCRDCGVCVGGRGPYSPWPAASASAAPTAASAVHPCGGGPVAAALE